MAWKPKYVLGITALLALVIAAFTWWGLRLPHDPVAFHKAQMEQAYEAHYAEPDSLQGGLVGYAEGNEYEQYEFHRSRLIELGAVLELNYQFAYLLVPTDESEHFSKYILSNARPSCIEFSSPYPNEPEPMQLTVWCYPEDKAKWDELIADRDVENYEQTFMKK